FAEVITAQPGRKRYRPRARRVGAQLEHHWLGIRVGGNVHAPSLITKQPQFGSVGDKEHIQTPRRNVERLHPRAVRARCQDYAGEQAERHAYRNGLRALALQVTRPRSRPSATGSRFPRRLRRLTFTVVTVVVSA